jgi:hypothetical protein
MAASVNSDSKGVVIRRMDFGPFVDSGPVAYRNEDALKHARELYPAFAGNFVQSDIFDPQFWDRSNRYTMTLLTVGRLLEVPTSKAF